MSTRGPLLALLLATLAAPLTGSPASAAPLFSRVGTPPRAAALRRPEIASAFMSVDHAALARFRAQGGGRLTVPLPGGETVDLSLTPFDVFAPGARLVATGPNGEQPLKFDLTMFRGSVPGEAGSWAVLSMSGDQVLGTIAHAGRRFSVAPATSVGGDHVVTDESTLPGHSAFQCDADLLPEIQQALPPRDRYGLEGADAVTGSTRLVCDLAVDTDYEYYGVKFGANLTNAQNYLATLIGTVSAIYERDINVTLRLSYVNIWTTTSDPYDSTTTSATLTEVQNYWYNNKGGIARTLVHHISGRPLGGGIAWINVLCDTNYGYAVSQVDATYSYPTNTTTWDAECVAHEIGHNFGAWHTHSCNWKTSGYIAAGTLDTCQVSECGTVYGPNHVPPDKGTIMSYCHLIAPIANAIRLDFHPVCITRMRATVETAAGGTGCVAAAAVQPPVSVHATLGASGAVLAWTASPTSGVIRYDIYKSATQLDLNPALIGSTTGTNYTDMDLGTFYYKVKAVRTSDASAFSNEVRTTPCVPQAPVSYAVGLTPFAVATADLSGDGILDLAVADFGSDQVSILTGNGAGGIGNGTFATAVNVNLPAGSQPYAIAVGDINGDGAVDLAVADFGTSMVSILLNSGTGTFTVAGSFATAAQPSALVIDDFNDDGIADIAVACQPDLTVLTGNGIGGVGNGTFTATTLSTGVIGRGVATGDFNADGITDIAIASSPVMVLLGHGASGVGDGTFAAPVGYAAGGLPYGIVTGDFNSDGITDLAVANATTGTVSLLAGNGVAGIGDGTFAPATSWLANAQAQAIAFGDWNQDGITDVAVANNSGTGTVSILTGRGTGAAGIGQFNTAAAFASGASPRAVAACDFNGDGAADIAVANANTNRVSVMLATCHGGLPATVGVTSPNGGEAWSAGACRTITWTKGTGVVAVNVALSRDAGLHWCTIGTNVTGTHLLWDPSIPTSTSAMVRVTDALAPQRGDRSDAVFSLLPAGSLAVPGPQRPAALAVQRVLPNPATSNATVWLTLPAPAPVTLELLDLSGRRVRSIALGEPGAGLHAVPLVRGALAPGVYLVRATQGDRIATARVVFVD